VEEGVGRAQLFFLASGEFTLVVAFMRSLVVARTAFRFTNPTPPPSPRWSPWSAPAFAPSLELSAIFNELTLDFRPCTIE